jgi:SAM-dependent methyltransferase
MALTAGQYAFPHSGAREDRRLALLEQRLDPLTVRRIERLGLAPGARCLEVGAGHGSIARWLCDRVGPTGSVTAVDLETDFLEELALPGLVVVRTDLRTDDLPAGPFDLVHARAVLMHIDAGMAVLERMASVLAPGGWLVVEEPDFGMWQADYDPIWAAHPPAWHVAFPEGSLSRGRALLRQIGRLGLTDIGADAELDIVQAGTPLAEFHALSLAALAPPVVAAGVRTQDEADAMAGRATEPGFLGCGFAHIGVWGRNAG